MLGPLHHRSHTKRVLVQGEALDVLAAMEDYEVGYDSAPATVTRPVPHAPGHRAQMQRGPPSHVELLQ